MSPSRRRLLAGLGALASLPGCSGLAGDRSTPTPSDVPHPTDYPTDTARPTDSPTPTPTHPDADWPNEHGDAANTSHAAVAGPTDPAVAWDRPIRFAHPILDGNLVVASDGERVVALTPDGSERWMARPIGDGDMLGGLALADEYVLLGTTSGLVALDRDDGSEAWSRTPGDSPAPPVRFPVASGETVYVAPFGTLYAYSTADGSLRWSRSLDDQGFVPAVADGAVYLTTSDDGETVLRSLTTDGRDRWHRSLGDCLDTLPVVGGGLVRIVCGSDHGQLRVYALAASDGTERWTDRGGAVGPPAADGGRTYLGTAGSGSVRAYAPDGDRQWLTAFDGEFVRTATVLGDERVYVGGTTQRNKGFVNAYSRADGAVEWTVTLGEQETASTLALAAGTLYVGTDERLLALRDR